MSKVKVKVRAKVKVKVNINDIRSRKGLTNGFDYDNLVVNNLDRSLKGGDLQ